MKYSDKIQEKLLLLRIKSGDSDAFAILYNRYVDQIYRFVFFKVSTREEAEDITSDVFLKVWQYTAQGEQEIKSLRAFAYQIARNLVIDYYRKRARTDIVSEEFAFELPDEEQQSLLKSIDAKAEFEVVEKGMRKLKDEYREVIILRYIEDLTISEIAKVLNKSKGSVRVLIHRAIKVLKEHCN